MNCLTESSQELKFNIKFKNYILVNIASYIDHAALHPTQTRKDIVAEIELARKYKAASICVKPYAVSLAAELLKDSETKVCTVIGFPHGSNLSDVKAFEAQRAIEQGAEEIDMVVNIGKALEADWDYVESDVAAVLAVCRKAGALLKVIVETDYVQDEIILLELCRICSKLKVDFIKTSTGFGYRKSADGIVFVRGAELKHVKLFKENLTNGVKIKASGGVRNYQQAKEMIEAGAERLGTSALVAIVNGQESDLDY